MESIPKSKIIIQNFISRSEALLASLDSNLAFGIDEIVSRLNLFLFKIKREFNDRILLQNISEIISKHGRDSAYDSRIYRLTKYPFSAAFSDSLFRHYCRILKILYSPRKKCIVVDLDNTLWGGIAAQDGIQNLILGSFGSGEAFLHFQKVLLNYYRMGMYLAICSKNNYEDALEVIEKHPDMILKKELFSSIKINWSDKVSNLIQIADELNIGIDTLVFLDDDPAECDFVRQYLPEVMVINLTGSPDNYINQLLETDSLQTISLTVEDSNRNSKLTENIKRNECKNKFLQISDYYLSLNMQGYINTNNLLHSSRVSQLTQRTNQFNLTARRYTSEEIINYISDKHHNVYSLRLVDKYGDNGIIASVIIKKELTRWYIENLLLSCRVIARQAETALLNIIIQDAERENVKSIAGEYLPTKRNLPAADFFEKHSFTQTNETEWLLTLPAKTFEHFLTIFRES